MLPKLLWCSIQVSYSYATSFFVADFSICHNITKKYYKNPSKKISLSLLMFNYFIYLFHFYVFLICSLSDFLICSIFSFKFLFLNSLILFFIFYFFWFLDHQTLVYFEIIIITIVLIHELMCLCHLMIFIKIYMDLSFSWNIF